MVEVVNAAEFAVIFAYLSKTEMDLKDIFSKSQKAYKICLDAKVDSEDSYQGVLAKTANEYKEKAENTADDIRYYAKEFVKCVSICIKNLDKNEYFQNKQKILNFRVRYKKILKNYEQFEKEIARAIDKHKDDYRKFSAFMKISIKNDVFMKIIKYTMEQLDRFEG